MIFLDTNIISYYFNVTVYATPIALLAPLSDKTLENAISSIRQARAINAVKLYYSVL